MISNEDIRFDAPQTAGKAVPFPLQLDQIFGPDDSRWLIEESSCSRRIVQEARFSPSVADFVQPIDVHLGLPDNSSREMPNMDGYPQRSVDNAIDFMEELHAKGIDKVFIRILDDEKVATSPSPVTALHRHGAAIAKIRAEFPKGQLELTVDPFNEALNSNGTWGIIRDKQLDFQDTATLLINLADVYAAAGTDYLLTLGRVEHEVKIVAKALEMGRYDTKIASFSTNVETTNAYAYLPDSIAGRNTGQKILNGNIHEMLLRAIVDVHEGSRYVIVKPAENTYLVSELARILNDQEALRSFLREAQSIGLTNHNPACGKAVHQICSDIQSFCEKAAAVRLGTYTVSGTYFSDNQLLARKGAHFTRETLEERFSNIMASGYLHSSRIHLIDRNAHRFVCGAV